MFAVVKTGAKQYKVAAGDVIKVEKLDGDAGATITLDHILMVGNDKGVEVGTPTVSGTVVTAEILEQARAAKIIIFKKKRRQNYRRKNGHRQELTVLRILEIGPKAAKTAAKKATPEKVAAKPTAEKTVAEKKAAPKAEAAPKKAAAKKATAPKKAATPKKTAAKKPAAKKTKEK
ncbi:LSU ribosomal protein L21p [hydrothermal vent metagenome]|uniref:LSU ribosomal protein L21p n=1 Tax=hydrothermal vent metagenome TaxID=652676 RepID=A0A3B1B201_9ZZZZ